MCEPRNVGDALAVGGGIAEKVCPTVEVEDSDVTRDFRHKLPVVLGFRYVGSRALRIDAAAVARPFGFDRD